MAELKAKGICDFCGEACNADMQGAKAYDCEDFSMALTGAMSYGAWGACPACAALIDSEHWHALEDRLTEVQSCRFGFLAETMLSRLREMHAQQIQLFREHRKPLLGDEDSAKAGNSQGEEHVELHSAARDRRKQIMAKSRRYVDRQEGVQTFFPSDFKQVEARVIVEAWKNKSPDEDLWFVFVTCQTASQELRFIYPIGAPPGTAQGQVLRNAQAQHSRFGRPALTAPPEVLLMTEDLVERLTPRSRGTGDMGLCDFCRAMSKNRKVYPARDFRLPNGSMSVGGWAACPACAASVDTEDEDALVARMIPSDATDEKYDLTLLNELTRKTAREFFANRSSSEEEIPERTSAIGLRGHFGTGGYDAD